MDFVSHTLSSGRRFRWLTIVDEHDRSCLAIAYARGIRLDFIQPGKPVQNCFIESFNGTLRDECLNLHWFLSLTDARHTIEDWRLDYNTERPHSSLGDLPPRGVRGPTFTGRGNPRP